MEWVFGMDYNQTKYYYITLCVFFIAGAFATAYVTGQQVESLPDMSWQTPDNFVAYVNSYLNEKVNPSTLADVLVTQYIDHPLEATNVMPLYPMQSIIQERFLVNCSITELESYLVPGDEYDVGTTVGIGFFTKDISGTKWKLQSYQTVETQDLMNKSVKMVIETPRMIFDADGGFIRIAITNFGTERSDVVYIPTMQDDSSTSEFYGVNTAVDKDESIFMTIKNVYRKLYGARYVVTYEQHEGIMYHEQTFTTTSEGEVAIDQDKIIALFEHPSLLRKDSILNPYSEFETTIQKLFPTIDPRFVHDMNDLLKSIPVIGSFFKFKPQIPIPTYTTMTEKTNVNILDYSDQLLMRSQNDLDYITQPVLRTLKLSSVPEEIGSGGDENIIGSLDTKHELMDYFERTFIQDYNEFETTIEYELVERDSTTLELIKSGQQTNKWIIDLTQPPDRMVSEITLLNPKNKVEKVSIQGLLNALNKQYYSPNTKGTAGLMVINGRKSAQIIPETSPDVSFGHLVRLLRGVNVPSYTNMKIVSKPEVGSFTIYGSEDKVIQQYYMFDDREFRGATQSLVSSQENRINMFLTKLLGPWSNLQVPDTRPVDQWVQHLYAMEDDKDENNYWSPLFNDSRPLALSEVGVGDTTKGWYMGDGLHNYDQSTSNWHLVDDDDWDTSGVTWLTGFEEFDDAIDLKIQGQDTGYWTADPQGIGHFMDNNGWIMLDLGEDTPATTHWHVSFDFNKVTEANPQGAGYDSGDNIVSTGGEEWIEAGLGIHLTDDIGILELMERHGTYSDDIGFWIPLQIGDGNTIGDGYTSFSVYDPFFVGWNDQQGFVDYDLFYNDILDNGEQLWHWPGGTLWAVNGALERYYHEMTYTHRAMGDRGILQLNVGEWYHVDIYYDEITCILNILINGVPVMLNLYIPSMKDEAGFENIWFYNYGRDETHISNLILTDAVAPIPIPLMSSITDVGRLTGTDAMDLDGAIIPYWGSASHEYWDISPELGSLGDVERIGQNIELGLGAREHIYWMDINADGNKDSGEYVTGDVLYQGKGAVVGSTFTESSVTHNEGLLALQTGTSSNLLSPTGFNYTFLNYDVGWGEITNLDPIDRYPQNDRHYSNIIELEELEYLLRSLLITDYDFTTDDFSYFDYMSSPWTGDKHHEELWGDAVLEIMDSESGGYLNVNTLTGWGMVLLSLITLLDATSSYKVSPLWDKATDYPSVQLDQDGESYTTHDDFWGFRKRELDEPDIDRFWTPGYAGVVSFEGGGEIGLSSFYAGDASENVTYGGRKWYVFGLDDSEVDYYKLSTSMLSDTDLNEDLRYQSASLSDRRLVIQGIRQWLHGQGEISEDYETYTLHLATMNLDGSGNKTIVIPAKWNTTLAGSTGYVTDTPILRIYDDPSELFVRLIDEDYTGVFERYEKGPLGKYMAPEYMAGNAMDWIQLEASERPTKSIDWIMEALSGFAMNFLETLPMLSDIFDLVTQTLTWGVVEVLGVAMEVLHLVWDPIVKFILVPSELNWDYRVSGDEIDENDGTTVDDGLQRIDEYGIPDSTGRYTRSWGIKGNNLHDDYDQKIVAYMRILDQLIIAFKEFLNTNHEEFASRAGSTASSMAVLADLFAHAYTSIDPYIAVNDWTDLLHENTVETVILEGGNVYSEFAAQTTLEKALKALNLGETNQIWETSKVNALKTVGGLENFDELDSKFSYAFGSEQLNINQIYNLLINMYLWGRTDEGSVELKKLIQSIRMDGRDSEYNMANLAGLNELTSSLFGWSGERGEGYLSRLNYDEAPSKRFNGYIIDYSKLEYYEDDNVNPLLWKPKISDSNVYSLLDLVYDWSHTDNTGTIVVGDDGILQIGTGTNVDPLNQPREDAVRELLAQILASQLEKIRQEYPGTDAPESVSVTRVRDAYNAVQLVMTFGGQEVPLIDFWLQDQLLGSLLRQSMEYEDDSLEEYIPDFKKTQFSSDKSAYLGAQEEVVAYEITAEILGVGDLQKGKQIRVALVANGKRTMFIDEKDFNDYLARQIRFGSVPVKANGEHITWADVEANKVVLYRSNYEQITGLAYLLTNTQIAESFRQLSLVTPPRNRQGLNVDPRNGVVHSGEENRVLESFRYSVSPNTRFYSSDVLRRIAYGEGQVVWMTQAQFDQVKDSRIYEGRFFTQQEFAEYRQTNSEVTTKWDELEQLNNYESYPNNFWIGLEEYAQVWFAELIEFQHNEYYRDNFQSPDSDYRYDPKSEKWFVSEDEYKEYYAPYKEGDGQDVGKWKKNLVKEDGTHETPAYPPIPGTQTPQTWGDLENRRVTLEETYYYSRALGREITQEEAKQLTGNVILYKYHKESKGWMSINVMNLQIDGEPIFPQSAWHDESQFSLTDNKGNYRILISPVSEDDWVQYRMDMDAKIKKIRKSPDDPIAYDGRINVWFAYIPYDTLGDETEMERRKIWSKNFDEYLMARAQDQDAAENDVIYTQYAEYILNIRGAVPGDWDGAPDDLPPIEQVIYNWFYDTNPQAGGVYNSGPYMEYRDFLQVDDHHLATRPDLIRYSTVLGAFVNYEITRELGLLIPRMTDSLGNPIRMMDQFLDNRFFKQGFVLTNPLTDLQSQLTRVPTNHDIAIWKDVITRYGEKLQDMRNDPSVRYEEYLNLVQKYFDESYHRKLKTGNQDQLIFKNQVGISGALAMTIGSKWYIKGGKGVENPSLEQKLDITDKAGLLKAFGQTVNSLTLPHDMYIRAADGSAKLVRKGTSLHEVIRRFNQYRDLYFDDSGPTRVSKRVFDNRYFTRSEYTDYKRYDTNTERWYTQEEATEAGINWGSLSSTNPGNGNTWWKDTGAPEFNDLLEGAIPLFNPEEEDIEKKWEAFSRYMTILACLNDLTLYSAASDEWGNYYTRTVGTIDGRSILTDAGLVAASKGEATPIITNTDGELEILVGQTPERVSVGKKIRNDGFNPDYTSVLMRVPKYETDYNGNIQSFTRQVSGGIAQYDFMFVNLDGYRKVMMEDHKRYHEGVWYTTTEAEAQPWFASIGWDDMKSTNSNTGKRWWEDVAGAEHLAYTYYDEATKQVTQLNNHVIKDDNTDMKKITLLGKKNQRVSSELKYYIQQKWLHDITAGRKVGSKDALENPRRILTVEKADGSIHMRVRDVDGNPIVIHPLESAVIVGNRR